MLLWWPWHAAPRMEPVWQSGEGAVGKGEARNALELGWLHTVNITSRYNGCRALQRYTTPHGGQVGRVSPASMRWSRRSRHCRI